MRSTFVVALVIVVGCTLLLRGRAGRSEVAVAGGDPPPAAVAEVLRGGAEAAATDAATGAATVPRAPDADHAAAAEPPPVWPVEVTVVVRLDGIVGDLRPTPELLCVTPGEPIRAVPSNGEAAVAELAAVRGTFAVARPGRYAAAWHVWRQVPGTRTWRALRGRGPEIAVTGAQRRQQITVALAAGDLTLDAALDAIPEAPHWRTTAKDGD